MDRTKAGASPINAKALIGQTLHTTPANTYITAGPSAASSQIKCINILMNKKAINILAAHSRLYSVHDAFFYNNVLCLLSFQML